jgi:subtilisin family serine protease
MKKPGLILLGLLTVAGLEAQDRKLAPELAIPNRTHERTVDVIVQYKAGAFPGVHSRIDARGGKWKRHLDLIGGAVYSAPADMVDLIAADPDVVFVSPDRPVHATAFSGTADYGWMTALDLATNTATLPWDGAGIGVAVIDSGITGGLNDFKDANGHSRIVY